MAGRLAGSGMAGLRTVDLPRLIVQNTLALYTADVWNWLALLPIHVLGPARCFEVSSF